MAKTLTEIAHASLDRFSHLSPSFDYSRVPDPAVAARAKAAVDRIRDLQRGAIVEIGQELIKVKEELEHGMFIAWLEALGMNRRTASNYMAAASAFGDKWEIVSHLPANVLYKLASPKIPAEVREAVFRLTPGQRITVDSIGYVTGETEKTRYRRERNTKEFKQARAEDTAKLLAQVEQQKAEAKAGRDKAAEVAEKARFMLGGYFGDLCDLMVGVDTWTFVSELGKLMKEHREKRREGDRHD